MVVAGFSLRETMVKYLMFFKEKKHRLSLDLYTGEVSISFTLCIKNRAQPFTNPDVVNCFCGILEGVVGKGNCNVQVYCFMPDHLHLILTGTRDDSNLWDTIVKYKQKTGYWLSKNSPEISWQKDFFDHIIRKEADLPKQAYYILDNPVRRSLVSSWEQYPFKGSIGCRLEDVLKGF